MHRKKGGRRRADTSFLPFKNMLDNCGMIGFPFVGNSFSWAARTRAGRMQCRLDRPVDNEDWHQLFFHTYVEYFLRLGSDHRPILARFVAKRNSVKRGFRFDRRWIGKEGFTSLVKEGWEAHSNDRERSLYNKIKSSRDAISRWKRHSQTNNEKLIESLKKRLESTQDDEILTSEEELEIKWKLCAAYREEEIYWRQKNRTLWLRGGDRNTKYFHAKTKLRKVRNRITRLKNSMSQWVETYEKYKYWHEKTFNI